MDLEIIIQCIELFNQEETENQIPFIKLELSKEHSCVGATNLIEEFGKALNIAYSAHHSTQSNCIESSNKRISREGNPRSNKLLLYPVCRLHG